MLLSAQAKLKTLEFSNFCSGCANKLFIRMGVSPQSPTARHCFSEQYPCAFCEGGIARCGSDKLSEFFNDSELLISVKCALISQYLHTNIVTVTVYVRY